MADPVIPGARDHRYRHGTVPGPRLIEARGIDVVHGAKKKPGAINLKADRHQAWAFEGGAHPEGDAEEFVILTVDGVLSDVRIPREALEAFMEATRR